ncbi:hypothetical protein [Butyrivibrio sp. LC3010]|uniref:hypothetical protein n=1 Tax=Butyrivibrio sp. LC3010 TaxID=1280680 RepID=UPI000426D477|nr:hypothetical protein [Butyrivibrio sp. LC3010]
MQIKIGQYDYSECWDGVFYKKLSDYPYITEWEKQTVLDFEKYEASNGRTCDIEADSDILNEIDNYRCRYNGRYRVSPPDKITECTACPKYKGCLTDLVCHTSPLENAVQILECGNLLSPVRARKMSAAQLREESRNAANDPEDYFDYIMFAWGNCQAGDRLVMERNLGRFPDEKDLSVCFTPGVRFFFRYKDLIMHPDAVFEGVLPLKVKNEVVLKDWVYTIVAPSSYREVLAPHVPDELSQKVHFIDNDCTDIWAWSEKVYEYAHKLGR